MTFIEVHINEDESALEKLIKDAYTAIYRHSLSSVGLGRVIVWKGRLFQELQLPKPAEFGSYEDRVIRCWNLPEGRARLQLGSIRGEVFTTPPDAGDELVARIREAGRCGKEYVVRPFHYSENPHEG